jgi:hypothetical protein
MKKLIPILSAAALSITAMGAAMAPASAAPYQQNQMQRHDDQHQNYQKKPQPKFERHGSYAYYNGKKGYKTKHSGYRYYNGYWFPPAAFVAGGLIFGAIVNGIVQSQR